MVDAQSRRDTRTEALDDHVGVVDQREEPLVVGLGLQVEGESLLSPPPHERAGERLEGVAARRLDARDVGALVGEDHAGHRAGDAPREIEDGDVVQHSP